MSPTREDLWKQLKAIRKGAGVTQVQMAEHLELNAHSQVGRIERGLTDTTLDRVMKWAELCDYEVRIVPKSDASVERVLAKVAEVRGDKELETISTLVDLLRYPARWWSYFTQDFRYEAARASRSANSKSESA